MGNKLFCCEKVPAGGATPEEEVDTLDSDWTTGCDARSVADGAVASSGLAAGSPATTGFSGTAALAAWAAHDDCGRTEARECRHSMQDVRR